MLALFMNKLNIVRFPDYKVYGLSCAKFKMCIRDSLSAGQKQKPHTAGMDIQPIMMLLKIQKQRKKNTQCEKKSSTPVSYTHLKKLITFSFFISFSSNRSLIIRASDFIV